MTELDLCTLGAAQLNPETNIVTVQTLREFGEDGETEGLGDAPMMCALGLTAIPLGPSDEGHAEGIAMSPCGPYASGIVGATDTRCADVYGQCLPGDTCLHSTGADPATRSRVFCKENLIAFLIGNDAAIVFDREKKSYKFSAFGHATEISETNGVIMAEKDGAWLQLKGGKATIAASGINLSGAISVGGDAALPPAMATPLLGYLTALETLVGVIAPLLDTKLPPIPPPAPATPATIAMTAFLDATAALKAAIPATLTRVT